MVEKLVSDDLQALVVAEFAGLRELGFALAPDFARGFENCVAVENVDAADSRNASREAAVARPEVDKAAVVGKPRSECFALAFENGNVRRGENKLFIRETAVGNFYAAVADGDLPRFVVEGQKRALRKPDETFAGDELVPAFGWRFGARLGNPADALGVGKRAELAV